MANEKRKCPPMKTLAKAMLAFIGEDSSQKPWAGAIFLDEAPPNIQFTIAWISTIFSTKTATVKYAIKTVKEQVTPYAKSLVINFFQSNLFQ